MRLQSTTEHFCFRVFILMLSGATFLPGVVRDFPYEYLLERDRAVCL